MTPEHIHTALYTATKVYYTIDLKLGHIQNEEVDLTIYAKMIQFAILDEVLALAKANLVNFNDAKELYKDLQAYDRFERGLNF